jgi:hypothetical protein
MVTLVRGEGWQEPELQKILRERLRPKTVRAFVEAVGALTLSLHELGDKLGLDEESHVSAAIVFCLFGLIDSM